MEDLKRLKIKLRRWVHNLADFLSFYRIKLGNIGCNMTPTNPFIGI